MAAPPKLTNPGVRFPPPSLFLLGVGLAWLLETRVTRIKLVNGEGAVKILEGAGVALLIAGLVVLFWGMLTFARAKTAILPMRPASALVNHGPYRFTRNPMYTGMGLAYIGGAIGMNWGWALILFPFVLALLYRFVISREEAYLSAAFGTDYDDYRRRVRRWI